MSLLKRSFISSLLLVIEKFANRLVGLASTLVLARVLMPEDFGIVAIAVLVVGALEVLAKTNGGAYLLRFSEITPQMLNTAFTIDVCLKSIVAFLLIVLSPFIANYYEDDRLIAILIVLACMSLIGALVNPGLVLLKQQQRYEKIVKLQMLGKLVAASTSVAIAFVYQTYWALVIGKVIQAVFSVTGSYMISSHRPKLTLHNYSDQLKFSVWLIPQALMGYLRTQIDTFIVSANFTKAELGAYFNMKYFAFLPAEQIITPATIPLYVQLSSIRHAKAHYDTRSNVSFFIPLCMALYFGYLMYENSEVIVSVILGEKWVEYSPLFAIFSYSIIPLVFFQHANRSVMLDGKTHFVAIYEAVCLVAIVVVLLSVTFESLEKFAITKLALEFLFATSYFVITQLRYNGWRTLLRAMVLISICSFVMFSSSTLTNALIVKAETLFMLVLYCSLYTVLFIGIILLLLFSLKRVLPEAKYLIELTSTFYSKVMKRT